MKNTIVIGTTTIMLIRSTSTKYFCSISSAILWLLLFIHLKESMWQEFSHHLHLIVIIAVHGAGIFIIFPFSSRGNESVVRCATEDYIG